MYLRLVLVGLAAVLILAFSDVQAEVEAGTSVVPAVSQQPAVSSAGLLAQYDNGSSSGSTRVSGRGVRGLVKLAILVGILLISGVGWVIRTASGG